MALTSLQVLSVPVSDQDRAKQFYVGQLGFTEEIGWHREPSARRDLRTADLRHRGPPHRRPAPRPCGTAALRHRGPLRARALGLGGDSVRPVLLMPQYLLTARQITVISIR